MSEPIITKHCSSCEQIKFITEFFRDVNHSDGFQSHCKVCNIERNKKFAQTPKGRVCVKIYSHRYFQSKKGETTRKKYLQTERWKKVQRESDSRYRKNHSKQIKARRVVNSAIKGGHFVTPSKYKCFYCPAQAQEYHHPDYSKPLDVIPVCVKCHKHLHIIAPSVTEAI